MVNSIIKVFIQFFIIIDPFNVVPLFMSVQSGKEIKRIALDATLVAFSLLVVFALLGDLILRILSISLDSFMIAGGILLLLLSIEFVTEKEFPRITDELAAVPIGTPMLAGPGAISTAIIAMRNYGVFVTIPALAIAMAFTYIVLRYSRTLNSRIGKRGIRIIVKVMGMLLTAVAVQFILEPIYRMFKLAK